MTEEIFDVVNERDEVIGRMPRRQVHREKLRHRAVHVLIFNSKGEVFLQKRSMNKDKFPGVWDSSTSGHVDSGESFDAAAIRELWEEIGCRPSAGLERLFKIDACPETGWEFVWVYRGVSEGPFRLHPDEIDDGKWRRCEDVDRLIESDPREFASGFLRVWRELNT